MVKPQTPLTPNGNAHGHQGLWSQPNKFARPPGIEADGAEVTIHGYQEFKISLRNMMPKPMDHPLRRKKKLVQVYFEREFLAGKTVLDIGANGGFFSLWAAQSGASEVVALDMDETYLSLIRQAQQALGWKQIRRINERVQNWEEPADLVLAFAMVHWLFSCTANFGSLEAVVAKLVPFCSLNGWRLKTQPSLVSNTHNGIRRWPKRITISRPLKLPCASISAKLKPSAQLRPRACSTSAVASPMK